MGGPPAAGLVGGRPALSGSPAAIRRNSLKYSGKVLRTQAGSLMRTETPPSAASEKHMAMRWSS